MQEYRRNAHAVFLVTYHIVFVTKYRKPCIDQKLGEYLKTYCTDFINENGGCVHAIECDLDHIHILAELPMNNAVTKFLGSLKGNSARVVKRDFADYLKQFYWKDGVGFWSSSYFVASTGGVTMDVIKKYVDSQPTKKRSPGRQKKSEE